MGRSPCCEKVGLKKGPWTPEEDQKLLAYIEQHGHGSWRALPAKAGLQRCGKSCRLRWTNYLRPDIKRGKFSLQEEQTIIQLHALLGNRWSAIATHLPKRTDNEIKNYWNTHLKKRLAKMGIDPVTHKPKSDALGSADGAHSKSAATLSHMAQWESARLEAEARLARESKLRSSSAFASLHANHLPSSVELSAASSASPAPCLDVLRAAMGVWPAAKAARPPHQIDQESPTSTLSFSADSISSLGFMGRRVDVEGEPEVAAVGGFALELAVFGGDGAFTDMLKHVGFGDGLTDMLLEKADEQNSTSGSSKVVAAAPSSAEGAGEENKSYWNNILNLVNSSSPPGSSPLF